MKAAVTNIADAGSERQEFNHRGDNNSGDQFDINFCRFYSDGRCGWVIWKSWKSLSRIKFCKTGWDVWFLAFISKEDVDKQDFNGINLKVSNMCLNSEC